jgi:predicted nuclease of predicted toxin-antitoxin system
MKLLLDENLPKRLKEDFPEHQVFTMREMHWQGKKDGEILKLLSKHGFEAMLTFDKNLQYQQNLKNLEVTIILLSASKNMYSVLTKLSPSVKILLRKRFLPKTVFRISS